MVGYYPTLEGQQVGFELDTARFFVLTSNVSHISNFGTTCNVGDFIIYSGNNPSSNITFIVSQNDPRLTMQTLIGYPSITIDSKGWVGIGTQNPQYPFDVNVSTNIQGGGGGGGTLSNLPTNIFASNITIGVYRPLFPLTVYGNAYFSSNVGIGSTQPSATLDVAGTIKATNLILDGSISFGSNLFNVSTNVQVPSIRQVFYVQSNQSVFQLTTSGTYGASPSNALVVVNQQALSYYTPAFKDYDLTYLNTSNPPLTTYTVSLTTPAIFGDFVDITIWPQTIQTQGYGLIQNYIYNTYNVTQNSNTFITLWSSNTVANTYFYTEGRIGIGTTIAKKTLDVQGDINFSGGLFQNNQPYVSSQWTSNANTLYYLSNVGIGTATAKKTLDVQGDINFSGNLFQNNQPYVSSQWTSNTSTNTLYYLSNIGIGTATAKKTLDVQGDINFSGTLYQNGTPFTSGGGTSQWSSNGTALYYLNSVGIGTSTPNSILQLYSSSNTDITFTNSLTPSLWTHGLRDTSLQMSYSNQSLWKLNSFGVNELQNISLPNFTYTPLSPPVSASIQLSAFSIPSTTNINDRIPSLSNYPAYVAGNSKGLLYGRTSNMIPYMIFTGTDTTNGAYIDLGTQSFNLNSNGGATFAYYLKFTGENSWERIMDFGNGAGVNNFLIAREANSRILHVEFFNPSGTNLLLAPDNLIVNEVWTTIIVRLQKESGINTWSLALWYNGAFINSNVQTAPFTDNYTLQNCYIGKSWWSSDSYLSAQMYEALIINRNITDTEAIQLDAYLKKKYTSTQPVLSTLNMKNDILIQGHIGIGTGEPKGTLHQYGGLYSSAITNINNYQFQAYIQIPEIVSTNVQYAQFGSHLAMSGNGKYLAIAAISRNTVYIYSWNGRWVYQTLITGDSAFGQSMAFNYDGTLLVIGAPSATIPPYGTSGSAFLYQLNATTQSWSFIRILTPANIFASQAGSSVAISDDGTMIIVGCPGATVTLNYQGLVSVWYNPLNSLNSWVEQPQIVSITPTTNGNFGYSLQMTRDGTTLFIGSPEVSGLYTGSISVYKWFNNTWNFRIRQFNPIASQITYFGSTLAIDGGGTTLAVSAVGYNTVRGAIYIYKYTYNSNLGDTLLNTQFIQNSSVQIYTQYGSTLSFTDDGSTLFIGGQNYYKFDIYQRNTEGIYFPYYTVNEAVSIFDTKFGSQLVASLDGSMVLVGAPNTQVAGLTAVGAAYLVTKGAHTYHTTGKISINTDADSVTSTSTLLNIKGYAQKIFGPGTYDMMRLESHDSSPVVLTTGMLGTPTSTNQGYYITVSEPNVSGNRILALQTGGGRLGIGTTLPVQTLHTQGFGYFSSNVGIGTNASAGIGLFVNSIVRNANPYLYIAGTGGTVAHTAANPIKFNSIITDTHNSYNTTTFTYTAPLSGLYSIKVNAYTEVSVPANARIFLNVNGTNVAIMFVIPAAATQISCSGSTDYRLSTGDTVKFITNVSTSYYLINTNPYHSFATITFVG